ncbi:hypothetical protein ES705_40155 [subsurface metagenome]
MLRVLKSMLLPGFLSFVSSTLIMYYFPQTIEISSLIGLLITFIGAVFIAFAVFSSYNDLDLRSVVDRSSEKKIFPVALINPKRADEGIKIAFFGFGIQLAHELIKIIIP